MLSRASRHRYPAALGNAFGQGAEITVAILHRRHVAGDGAIGRFEEEYRLMGLLGQRHQAAVVLERCNTRGKRDRY